MRAELAALRDVLRQYDPPLAERIDAVLQGSDTDVEAFLMSAELWGGTGSIVDRAGAPRWWVAQHQIQEAFIALGEWQITHGYANPGVTPWVAFLKERELQQQHARDGAAQAGQVTGAAQSTQITQTAVPWSTRDVWLGVLALAVILGATYGLVYLLRALSLRPNPDLWTALAPTLLELLLLVPVWWFAVRKYHASSKMFGAVSFRFSVLAIGVGLLLAFYFGSGLYASLLHQFGLEVQRDITPVLRRLSTPWPFFAATVLVAPVVEETFFRGFVFAGLRSRYDWRWAAAISSALFAAAHLEITFFLPAFALGYLFAYLYQRSNSIWPGMIIHALLNGIAVAAAYSLT